MARRKRLELPAEAQTGLSRATAPFQGMSRMPIAEVAGDTAARAALDEVTQAIGRAEAEGRMVRKLPLERIDTRYLNRDRMVLDSDEMEVLKASIAARGQQAPIEVLALSSERFGLISGLRRVEALRALGAAEVLAFVRRPETAAASYVAMVEENEIRAPLGFYERANIVAQAAEAGVYRDWQAAVRGLFANVTAAKRSKILRFVVLRQAIGRSLAFPAAIPEKLGLALANAIETDRAVAFRIADALRKTPPADAAAERRILERALRAPGSNASSAEEVVPGIALTTARGRMTLTGPGVDAALEAELRRWLAGR